MYASHGHPRYRARLPTPPARLPTPCSYHLPPYLARGVAILLDATYRCLALYMYHSFSMSRERIAAGPDARSQDDVPSFHTIQLRRGALTGGWTNAVDSRACVSVSTQDTLSLSSPYLTPNCRGTHDSCIVPLFSLYRGAPKVCESPGPRGPFPASKLAAVDGLYPQRAALAAHCCTRGKSTLGDYSRSETHQRRR